MSSNTTLCSTWLGDTTLNNTSLLRKRRKILLSSRPPINDLSLDEVSNCLRPIVVSGIYIKMPKYFIDIPHVL